MKVARCYIRVSTQEQADEGYSIQGQKERLTSYCKAMNYIIDDFYIDGGFSGTNRNRPGLEKLIKDIENKDTDIVLVYKLDRLSRSQKDTLYLIEEIFLKNKVAFVSMQESFDTSTAFGRAMVGILSVFAQLEVENMKERSKMGKAERAKEGLWGGGIDPFGYDYVDGQLIKNANAEIVKKAYDLYLAGHGTPTIARELGNISRSKVRAWLLAPVYAGKIAHAGKIYPGQHEPIISWETFLEVQKVMESRSNKKGKTITINTLAGLVKCNQCGALYGARRGQGYHYLYCYSRTGYIPEMVKKEGCKNDSWRLDRLLNLVEEELFDLIYDEEYFFKQINKKRENKIDKELIQSEIKELDKKIDKIMNLMLDEDLQNIDNFKNKIKNLHDKKNNLLKILEEEKEESENNEDEFLKDTVFTINNKWEILSVAEKNELLRRVIHVIWIDGDTFEIVWKF